VAIDPARRGIDVVGVHIDKPMLAPTRRRAPQIAWHCGNLADLDFAFDVMVMAGNVPLFTAPGTEPARVAGVARHVAPIAGFCLDHGYTHRRLRHLLRNRRADPHRAVRHLVQRALFTDGDHAVSAHPR
jgi:hypothetical protein